MRSRGSSAVTLSLVALLGATMMLHTVESYPGELVYSCAVNEKDWEGEYTPWSGHTKNAHAHLTFDDGPLLGDTDVILDVLLEYDTKATFFLRTDLMDETTRYLVDRMIDEGHTIGSHSLTHRNLQYGNHTVLTEEILHAHFFFKDYLGFQPKIFRPPYGSLDHRSHKLLEELGYTIVMWSAGCVDWWFTGEDKDLETSIAAMRYSLAEAGGIVCMHDESQAPNDGERLRKFLDDTWNFWVYTDFNTCIDRSDVDEGLVFKTYNEFKRAVEDEAAGGSSSGPTSFEEAVGGVIKGEVYLTFDAGPIDATAGVLDVLRQTQTQATFFVNAFHLFGEGDENEDRALSTLKQTVKDGHVIANHSYNHMLHNCCREDDKTDCGAEVCNEIKKWNVRAYQNLREDTELFHFNTQVVRQMLKHDLEGKTVSNDHMHSMGRLPYTNSWRLATMDSDCACCTTDDVPPWDANFVCSADDPTFSSTLSSILATDLHDSGMEIYGWDLEWGPEDWGAQDVASSLTNANDLVDAVKELATGSKCKEHLNHNINIAYCDDARHQGKVVILTHDFLFEDAGRGMGATSNLPKLHNFIFKMKREGYVFKALDRYHDTTLGKTM